MKSWHRFAKGKLDEILISTEDDGSHVSLDFLNEERLLSLVYSVNHPETLIRNHRNWLNSGDLGKAKSLKDRSEYPFNNYGIVNVGSPIDWALGQPGRDNLSWQLHSLFFLRDLARAHYVTNDISFLLCANDVIIHWTDANIRETFPSPFSWNDHTTAFRIYNLSHLFLYYKSINLDEPHIIKIIISLIARHQRVLECNDFYVRGTNHGLDQSFYLYQSTTIFSFLVQSWDAKKISLDRISYELGKSFAVDNVHIENSPEYHDLILANTLHINNFIAAIDGCGVLSDPDSLFNDGLKYLAYIIRPDGCLPPIEG